MSSVEFIPQLDKSIDPTLDQLADIYQFPGLVVVGSMARAAIRGSFESSTTYEVCKPTLGFLHPRDIDIIAPNGEPSLELDDAAFINGPHAIDATAHLMCGAEPGSFALVDMLRSPIPVMKELPTVVRKVNGMPMMRTLPVGVQTVLESLCPTRRKDDNSRVEFLAFSKAVEVQLKGRDFGQEFPLDVISYLQENLSWKSIHV